MSDDGKFMKRAIELAMRAEGSVSPRPPVGAVVVRDTNIVGEGWTKPRPGLHAETDALSKTTGDAMGATVYVTLEPCSHVGDTAPCADALIAAGVARVVVGTNDPNPKVNGQGIAKLRAAGIEVTENTEPDACLALIEPFSKWVDTEMPFVTLKMAASLDGKTAAPDGTSMWITGETARAEVHDLRRRADAVIVGSMTVLRDDPQLTCRLGGVQVTQPLRVVMDGSGRTPETSRVFNHDAQTLVITNEDLDESHLERWRAAGADVARVPAGESGVDVRAALGYLGEQGICSALVEGGPTIAASLVASKLVDRFVLYLAPKLIGGDAPGLLNDGVKTLTDAWELEIENVRTAGEDLRIDARPKPPGDG
jgi:diaminohydroxyphosphoribosylaminopyrimidine deaminase / 5-amino-6-(5-phosphoribosylamino)uracil reductase